MLKRYSRMPKPTGVVAPAAARTTAAISALTLACARHPGSPTCRPRESSGCHERHAPHAAGVGQHVVGPGAQPLLEQAGVDRAEVGRDLEVVVLVEGVE